MKVIPTTLVLSGFFLFFSGSDFYKAVLSLLAICFSLFFSKLLDGKKIVGFVFSSLAGGVTE